MENKLIIENVLTEKNVNELQKIYDTIGLKTYVEYLNWVLIQGLKSALLKENNYEQEKIEEIEFDFCSDDFGKLLISYDADWLKCTLTIKFKLENNVLQIID